jgi:hypothetical protein
MLHVHACPPGRHRCGAIATRKPAVTQAGARHWRACVESVAVSGTSRSAHGESQVALALSNMARGTAGYSHMHVVPRAYVSTTRAPAGAPTRALPAWPRASARSTARPCCTAPAACTRCQRCSPPPQPAPGGSVPQSPAVHQELGQPRSPPARMKLPPSLVRCGLRTPRRPRKNEANKTNTRTGTGTESRASVRALTGCGASTHLGVVAPVRLRKCAHPPLQRAQLLDRLRPYSR